MTVSRPGLLLALCVLGCTSQPVELHTGGLAGCYAGMEPILGGQLLADARFGTAIKVDSIQNTWQVSMPPEGRVVPVMWPKGYTARRSSSDVEIDVLDEAGNVVATTGQRYRLSRQVAVPLGADGAFPACGVKP